MVSNLAWYLIIISSVLYLGMALPEFDVPFFPKFVSAIVFIVGWVQWFKAKKMDKESIKENLKDARHCKQCKKENAFAYSGLWAPFNTYRLRPKIDSASPLNKKIDSERVTTHDDSSSISWEDRETYEMTCRYCSNKKIETFVVDTGGASAGNFADDARKNRNWN